MKYVVNVLLISLLLNTIIWAAILVFDDDEQEQKQKRTRRHHFPRTGYNNSAWGRMLTWRAQLRQSNIENAPKPIRILADLVQYNSV